MRDEPNGLSEDHETFASEQCRLRNKRSALLMLESPAHATGELERWDVVSACFEMLMYVHFPEECLQKHFWNSE
ncbi:hypothetical protein BAUCODRAFT_32272 [Baudoinia panamericana UAMH 10762]|uniref:Uncharacterized protein n=1 Tax=Baudoinia panamericana (strain UAMH 10762) TaxID=717646 RepID=M2N2T0_BAUPA|nr:uncharacterized protein BAUCODRAFT_32272 [Baudoinia panamericana UAMH 10762]EMC98258.1 hypothetical protein BAUCODRAFT_32272 [Baudoinia panamericana UAMH 10762]